MAVMAAEEKEGHLSKKKARRGFDFKKLDSGGRGLGPCGRHSGPVIREGGLLKKDIQRSWEIKTAWALGHREKPTTKAALRLETKSAGPSRQETRLHSFPGTK